MICARETRIKAMSILNMAFERAVNDGLIQQDPLHSCSVCISCHACKPIALYNVQKMRCPVQHIADIKKPMDGNCLALRVIPHCSLKRSLACNGRIS